MAEDRESSGSCGATRASSVGNGAWRTEVPVRVVATRRSVGRVVFLALTIVAGLGGHVSLRADPEWPAVDPGKRDAMHRRRVDGRRARHRLSYGERDGVALHHVDVDHVVIDGLVA